MNDQAEIAAWNLAVTTALMEADETRKEAADNNRPMRSTQPRHDWGNRNVWRPVDPTNPWGPLVNKDGFTPAGECLFPKTDAA